MKGLFITFEGNEGCGKSTQIKLLADRLLTLGHTVQLCREPGGTPIGEEIRHTLKHSPNNQAMTPEAELLMMNASRAQLVRQVIRPALAAGNIVLSDRFYDSSLVYQGYGRGLDLAQVEAIIGFAVNGTRPDLTLILNVPPAIREARRCSRSLTEPPRDRFEEADTSFFERVEKGYHALATKEPNRIKVVDAGQSLEVVRENIWSWIQPLLSKE